MRKKWPLVLGASLLTGLVGLATFPKKAPKTKDDVLNSYVGNWQFNDHRKQTHSLKIESTFSITIDDKLLKAVLIELTKEKLVLRDEYGYHIVVQLLGDGQATLYDEAEDRVIELQLESNK
ncbi:DUF4828 domain-containing protein [Enterococcus sp. LJL120]